MGNNELQNGRIVANKVRGGIEEGADGANSDTSGAMVVKRDGELQVSTGGAEAVAQVTSRMEVSLRSGGSTKDSTRRRVQRRRTRSV